MEDVTTISFQSVLEMVGDADKKSGRRPISTVVGRWYGWIANGALHLVANDRDAIGCNFPTEGNEKKMLQFTKTNCSLQ